MPDQQPTTKEVMPVAEINKLRVWLVRVRDAVVTDLQGIIIKEITTDEEAQAAKETLVAAKQWYDKMSARRKAFFEPIKNILAEFIAFESEINYTSDKDNSYNLARKRIEAWDAKQLAEAKKKEYEAWLVKEQLKYKAEFKAKVQTQLSDMLSGLHRTTIDKMANWEKSLTLENIEASEKTLRNANPTLKQEHYDKCFHAWGKDPKVMTEKEEMDYLEELKKEFTFEATNERYQQIAAPIKNEYLAKIPDIKKALQEQAAAADEKRKAELKAQQDKAIEAQKQRAIDEANKKQAEETQKIADEKDLGTMNAEFTEQMMTVDVDKGPTKKVVSFTDDKNWLSPFLQVVSKVAVNPKFKGVLNAKGEYIPEVEKWLKFYAQYVGEPLTGLEVTEEAKTIVKK